MVTYIRNEYDIDAIALFRIVEKSSSEYQKTSTNAEILLKEIKYTCRFLKIDFDNFYKNNYPVVIHSDNNLYGFFISLCLAHYEIPKINLFLNHQKENFKGNYYAKKNNFVGLIEFLCYDMIKQYSLIKTDARLDKITTWIEKEKSKINIENDFKKHLEWIGDFQILKKISKELKIKGYTEKPTDFEKAFREKKVIRWLKEPEYLSYLLYCLSNYNPKQFKTGGKGQYKVASEYFYDYSEKVVKKINIKDLIHNITKRYYVKHSKLRKRVNLLIDTFLK